MNPNKTIDTLRRMRLHRMAELYHQAVTENLYSDLQADELLSLLVTLANNKEGINSKI